MDLQSIELSRLKNVAIYDGADKLLGHAGEIILPQPERSFVKDRGLGRAFSIEIPGPWKQPFAIFVEADIGTLELALQPVRIVCM